MADVTFGVKVPEEMKSELAELMKETQLTGKEFMGLLMSSYKLEKNKQNETLLPTDIEELQRLLQRIQNLYLNINERTSFVVEEALGVKDEEIQRMAASEESIKEEMVTLKESLQTNAGSLEKEKIKVREKEKMIKTLEDTLEEYKTQVQEARALNEQYTSSICGLNARILELERFELEIEERKEALQKLQIRNDELASEVWFLQREQEKVLDEKRRTEEKSEVTLIALKSQYELEQKNSLLEQKLVFTNKIELLKEEHFKQLQLQNEAFQNTIIGKEFTKK